jgi:AcrR family transcriptional regulator
MSTSDAQARAAKKRPYRLGKRADRREETRRRIVEAAVELHGSVGPARTTVAQIAERAGVQRHTYYAHFPKESDLFLACSGVSLERDPLPDPEAWRSVPEGRERLRLGLADLYGWYGRNAALTACVLRDAEHHAPTREIVGLRVAPTLARAAHVLGEGLDGRARALLGVALDFACWRALGGIRDAKAAAGIMADAICALGMRLGPASNAALDR